MPGRAGIVFALLVGTVGAAFAQSSPERPDPYTSGRAAMDAHDPAAAIAQFEQTHSKEGRAWLAVALMMESRAAGDRYVERAFEAAAHARADQPERVRPRADIAAALRPGEMVIAYLVAESHAYAWAFDRNALIGYPLPPPAQLALSVDQMKAYAGQRDRAGMERVAEDLAPALLGPVLERLPALTRVIFVMDGPLRQLPIGELPIDDAQSLSQRVAVSTVDDVALLDEVARTPPAPQSRETSWSLATLTIGGLVIAILLVVGAVTLLRL